MDITSIKRAAGASVMIALGDYVLLKIGEPFGPFLFAFGLLSVCILGFDLFTGKCGFLFEKRLKLTDLMIMLVVNLAAGYLCGMLFRIADPSIREAALAKTAGYQISFPFFLRSVFCGMIMYAAVKEYQNNHIAGILLGVPLFIFSGFQHCIANIITMGATDTFSFSILPCILGNFTGSLLVAEMRREKKKDTPCKTEML